ncbi:MAG TPA: hypothetical protein VIA06_06195 [Candidatus Dormibacteraeota bacterium]|jgi:predicted rRNA methylase YqxC with S4 and FtsJ domains|nr:hypothetical protein [Candidatus Dormibacteraeota bacterium]
MFELGLARPPADHAAAAAAVTVASSGAARSGWRVEASMESPVRGSRGSIEFLIHARRAAGR